MQSLYVPPQKILKTTVTGKCNPVLCIISAFTFDSWLHLLKQPCYAWLHLMEAAMFQILDIVNPYNVMLLMLLLTLRSGYLPPDGRKSRSVW